MPLLLVIETLRHSEEVARGVALGCLWGRTGALTSAGNVFFLMAIAQHSGM